MNHTRPSFTTDALLSLVRQRFDADLTNLTPGTGRGPQVSTTDCLMSALAMFGLKYPSLLQFDKEARAEQEIRPDIENICSTDADVAGIDKIRAATPARIGNAKPSVA
jgi:hypothetical protein